jgi:hypothetical protein
MQKPAFCADRHTANAITTALAKANQVMAYCQVVVPQADLEPAGLGNAVPASPQRLKEW